MIWLTWRQFRLQALVITGAVLALGIFLAVTGPGLLDTYQLKPEEFLQKIRYDNLSKFLYVAGQAIAYAVPPVIGAFWGAPLVARELEAGTHRLVWNQSISRTRWLVTKLAVTGLAAMAVSGVLSLAVTWWADPIDDAIGAGQANSVYNLPRMLPPIFGARGVVPIGYTAFAFALGVAVGLVVRRSVVAIAITLTAVIAVEILSPVLIRPNLITPTETSLILTAENLRGLQLSGPEEANSEVLRVEAQVPGNGHWKLSEVTVNSAGQVQKTLPSWVAGCVPPRPSGPSSSGPPTSPSSEACFKRLADEGYRQQITYIPPSKFWALQWREAALFLALGLLLSGFCFWRIRRDLS